MKLALHLIATGTCLIFGTSVGLASGQAAAPVANDTIRIWVSGKNVNSVQGTISSADLLKELNARCSGVALTDSAEKADYRLEAGYGWCCTPQGQSRGYKFALFNKDGDAAFSTKTHSLANAVKDVCKAIGHEKAH